MAALKDSHGAGWRRDTPFLIQRDRRHKERPPIQLFAFLRQSLEVEQLSNWHTPSGKQIFMQQDLGVSWRPHLKREAVTGHSCKTRVPDPSKHIDRWLNTSQMGHWLGSILHLLADSHFVIPVPRDADSHEENVTLLDANVALLGDFQNIRELYLMWRKAVELDALLFGIRGIVNQDSSS